MKTYKVKINTIDGNTIILNLSDEERIRLGEAAAVGRWFTIYIGENKNNQFSINTANVTSIELEYKEN